MQLIIRIYSFFLVLFPLILNAAAVLVFVGAMIKKKDRFILKWGKAAAVVYAAYLVLLYAATLVLTYFVFKSNPLGQAYLQKGGYYSVVVQRASISLLVLFASAALFYLLFRWFSRKTKRIAAYEEVVALLVALMIALGFSPQILYLRLTPMTSGLYVLFAMGVAFLLCFLIAAILTLLLAALRVMKLNERMQLAPGLLLGGFLVSLFGKAVIDFLTTGKS